MPLAAWRGSAEPKLPEPCLYALVWLHSVALQSPRVQEAADLDEDVTIGLLAKWVTGEAAADAPTMRKPEGNCFGFCQKPGL